jgi:predicted AAA+ superfamily ATPase
MPIFDSITRKMERLAYYKLLEWKEKQNKMPLILKGARQVGKTWLMKEFGKRNYTHVAYFNFESVKNLHLIFEKGFDTTSIISALNIESGIQIEPHNTLIIFDEIQACPSALTSLKYFQESNKKYDIIAAGSLLGVSLHMNQSFPVGKVDFMELFPLSFNEFLLAMGQEDLLGIINRKEKGMIEVFKDKYVDLLKQYYFIGGMPEAVNSFIVDKDFLKARAIQVSILYSYEQDFSKHAPYQLVPKLRLIWQSIVSQLGKENKKFTYSSLKKGARSKDYESALSWLSDAGLVYKIIRINKPGVPLKSYEDGNDFKLYVHDVGLLCAMAEIAPTVILGEDDLFKEFKGSLTEQFVLQQLKSKGVQPNYWTTEGSQAEVDFIIQKESEVIPIEVKAAENLKSKSLKIYYEKFQPNYCYRFSMSNYREQDWMINIPLYAIELATYL